MYGRTLLVTTALLALLFAAFTGCGDDEECTTCVEEGPKLSLQPKTLDLGDAIPTHKFDIVNLGTGTLDWTVSTSAPWISVDPASGSTMTEVDPVTISVARTGIDNGNYSTFVVVSSNAGADSVEVSMRVPAHLFEIEVKDDGMPVEGLRISLWNLLPCSVLQESTPCTDSSSGFRLADAGLDKARDPAHGLEPARRASASFYVDLESQSLVDFEIFDLDGERVDSLVDGEVLPAGQHSFLWTVPLDSPGTAVHEASLTVYSLDGTQQLYQESVYAVSVRTDLDLTEVGSTDEDGEFYTDDMRFFPGLVEGLPPFEWYDEDCVLHGEFTIEPVVYVYLRSEDGTQGAEYELTLDGMENEFILEWDPPAAANAVSTPAEAGTWERPPTVHVHRDVPAGAAENDLRGSCPNPFN